VNLAAQQKKPLRLLLAGQVKNQAEKTYEN